MFWSCVLAGGVLDHVGDSRLVKNERTLEIKQVFLPFTLGTRKKGLPPDALGHNMLRINLT